MEVGRSGQRVGPHPSLVGIEAAWKDHVRVALAISPRRFDTTEVHPFVPRVHLGDGVFKVDDDPADTIRRGCYTVPILIARTRHMSYALHHRLGLEEPYAQALGKPSKQHCGFYVWNKHGQFMFQNFGRYYAAKHFLDTVLGDREFKWLDRRTILCDDGMKVRGEGELDLETVIEYSFKGREGEFEHYEPMRSMYLRFARGEALPKEAVIEERSSTKRERTPSAPRAPRPDGLVTLAELCEELNIDPRVARVALRASKTEKPAHGWAWPKDQVASIEKVLKDL